MDAGSLFLCGFAFIVVVVIVLTVMGSIRQRRSRAVRPARHEGERQPQRGRVFKYGTNHSNNPEW